MLPGGDVFPEDAGSIAERRAAGSRVCHAPAGTSAPGPRCVRMVGHDSCFHSAKNAPEAAATPKAARAGSGSGWERAPAGRTSGWRGAWRGAWRGSAGGGVGSRGAGQQGQRLRMIPAFTSNYWQGVRWISSPSLFCALTKFVTLITHGAQNNARAHRATSYSRWPAFRLGARGLCPASAAGRGRPGWPRPASGVRG